MFAKDVMLVCKTWLGLEIARGQERLGPGFGLVFQLWAQV